MKAWAVFLAFLTATVIAGLLFWSVWIDSSFLYMVLFCLAIGLTIANSGVLVTFVNTRRNQPTVVQTRSADGTVTVTQPVTVTPS